MKFEKFVKSLASNGVIYERDTEERWLASPSCFMLIPVGTRSVTSVGIADMPPYGDSFHQSFVEEGLAMSRIRLGDKFNRFKTLSRATEKKVSDESIRDTLIDLANYAIMTVLEMEAADGE